MAIAKHVVSVCCQVCSSKHRVNIGVPTGGKLLGQVFNKGHGPPDSSSGAVTALFKKVAMKCKQLAVCGYVRSIEQLGPRPKTGNL